MRTHSILKTMKHPFIIPLIDAWHEPEFVCMAFKLYRQDLFELANDYGHGMPEGETD